MTPEILLTLVARRRRRSGGRRLAAREKSRETDKLSDGAQLWRIALPVAAISSGASWLSASRGN